MWLSVEVRAKVLQPHPTCYIAKTTKMIVIQNAWSRWIRNCQAFQRYHCFLCKPVESKSADPVWFLLGQPIIIITIIMTVFIIYFCQSISYHVIISTNQRKSCDMQWWTLDNGINSKVHQQDMPNSLLKDVGWLATESSCAQKIYPHRRNYCY